LDAADERDNTALYLSAIMIGELHQGVESIPEELVQPSSNR
jgi:hypothetical protein